MQNKMTKRNEAYKENVSFISLMPEQGRVLLTGTGKELVERIGIEAVRNIVLAVLLGGNVRDLTEPLTRRRITQLYGAVLMMLLQGWSTVDDFTNRMSAIAVSELTTKTRGRKKAYKLPAQWIIGLTDKQVQNVLRDSDDNLHSYVREFDKGLKESVRQFEADYGELKATVGTYTDSSGQKVEMGWEELIRLMTAIGSQTLAIRGSDKSMFGKLFEKLILGSMLSILGCERQNPRNLNKTEKVFWLSDSSGARESDATLLYRPGKLARFDIGFIGRGNSEISKDKLSRYEREAEAGGAIHDVVTFIVVDTLPPKSKKTQEAASRIQAEIIQMNWQYWPLNLAQRLQARLGFNSELATLNESQLRSYLTAKISSIPLQDLLNAFSVAELEEAAASESNESTTDSAGLG